MSDKHLCAIHNVEEIHEGGHCYLVCGECRHVFKTEKDLIQDDLELRSQYGATEPLPASNIWSCPHCLHDF